MLSGLEQRHCRKGRKKYLLCGIRLKGPVYTMALFSIFPWISGSIYTYMYTVKLGFQILGKNNISNKIMNTYLQVRHFPLA